MAKWQQKYRVYWDATWRSSADSLGNFDGDRKVQWESKGRRSRSLGLWSWTGRIPSSGLVSLWCGPGRRTPASRERYCGCCGGYFRAPEASAVRRMCGGAAPDHHGYLARIELELLMMKRQREDVFKKVSNYQSMSMERKERAR